MYSTYLQPSGVRSGIHSKEGGPKLCRTLNPVDIEGKAGQDFGPLISSMMPKALFDSFAEFPPWKAPHVLRQPLMLPITTQVRKIRCRPCVGRVPSRCHLQGAGPWGFGWDAFSSFAAALYSSIQSSHKRARTLKTKGERVWQFVRGFVHRISEELRMRAGCWRSFQAWGLALWRPYRHSMKLV